MKSSPQQLVIKSLGTLVLAAGFIFVVARTPFMAQTTSDIGSTMTAESREWLKLENMRFTTGARSTASPVAGSTGSIAGLEPLAGLFQARIAASGGDPGFASIEQHVAGGCTGAGRRYIEQVCRGCEILSGAPQAGESEVLMWTSGAPGSEEVSAVNADCTSVAADGSAVVDVLQFGGGPIDLAQGETGLALDIVPLLPRAERVAAFEMGGWLATIDAIADPRTAMNDMAIALKMRGWREAADYETLDVQVFEQQRVFTNSENALCVVSVNREGDATQLLTIMSSYTRG